MLGATSSDITSSNQVRDEDKNCNLTETLNKSEVSVVSSKNRVPRPAFKHELRNIAKSLRKNGVELIVKNNCSVGGSLKHAVRVGDIKLVKLRIHQGADVNGSGQKGSSLLHVAAVYGHSEIIKLLINNGARLDSVLNGPMKNGYTPLHLACLNNKIKCVKVLLKYGASVTPKCADVHHPIHIAVFENYVEVAALLLENGADVNLRFNNKFFYSKWGQPLFWKDMDLTLLHCSIARKHKEMTALLLEHGADIHLNTRSNKTSLMHAVEANDPELVKSILEKGANPNDRNILGLPVVFFTVLNVNHLSMYYNKEELYSDREKLKIMKLLYAAGADVNVKFRSDKCFDSLVHYTCMYGQLPITLFILHETNFDWRNIDYSAIKLSKFNEEAVSPNDQHDFKYISHLTNYFNVLKIQLLYYIFSRHMIGFPVKKELLSAIHSSNQSVSSNDARMLEGIKRNLEDNITYVKQTTIGNTKISFWHVLTCKMTELVRLSFHKDFRSLCLDDYVNDLNHYYDMVEIRWKTAIKRSTSIERSSKIMFNLFYNHLPYDCCEILATYFDDKELEDFINLF